MEPNKETRDDKDNPTLDPSDLINPLFGNLLASSDPEKYSRYDTSRDDYSK